MKLIILILTAFLISLTAIAQIDTANIGKQLNNIAYIKYSQLKHFLLYEKNNPESLLVKIKPQWNSKLYQHQYEQLLAINKKKDFYPVILFDSRFVSQSYPSRYGSQNYMWISTQPEYENLWKQITSDIISDAVGSFLNSKKHRFNAYNKMGYYTPAGLKY